MVDSPNDENAIPDKQVFKERQWKIQLGIFGCSNYAFISHGLDILRTYSSDEEELAVYPMFACLSLGYEQSFKAVLSLARVAAGGEWCTDSELRRYRHNLRKLKDDMLVTIQERLNLCEHQPWIEYLYELVSRDSSIDPFIDLLSEYGGGGRYYSLDILSGKEKERDSRGTWMDWGETLDAFIRTEPGFKEDFFAILSSEKLEFDSLKQRAQDEIADRLQRLYDLMTEAGTHHLLGEDGVLWYNQAQGHDPGLRKRMDVYRDQAMRIAPEKFCM